MTPANRWLVLAIVSSALLLIVIDMTVLYTALPVLTHDLAATASQKLWILNAYALVVAGLLPGSGTLGDRFGHRRMFMIGLVIFGIASGIAAFAPNAQVLIAARALLAVGAAAMMPATLSLIRLTFEDNSERSLAIGIWAAVASGGAAFGPVVGGFLLEYYWWGSVFLINLPIVLIAFVATLTLIAPSPTRSTAAWDFLGSMQIMVALVALAYAMKEAARRDPAWELAALAFAIGSIALVVFIRRQIRQPYPLIDLGLFRIPSFSAGVIAALTAAMVLVGVELVMTQRLQLVLGMSPLQAGLYILPIPLAAFVGGPAAGLLLPRLGDAKVLIGGMAISMAGLILFLPLRDSIVFYQAGALALMGLGIGGAMTAASSTIMGSAPPERAGMAAAVEEVSYELGGAIGIAVLGSIMTLAYTRSMPTDLRVDPTAYDSLDEALLLAETMPHEQAARLTELARAAFEQSFIWVTSAAILLLGLACLWLTIRLKNQRRN